MPESGTERASHDQPLPAESVDRWDLVTDVLIVGSGSAGMSAGIEAATAGAQVLILEAASDTGGSSRMSGGQLYLGGGTPTQQACGFDDDTESMYQYLLLAAGPNADVSKVRLYCDRSLEHYDWLTRQGVEFKPEYYPKKHTNTTGEQALMYTGSEMAYPFSDAAKPAPRGHKPLIVGDYGGIPLMDCLSASALAAGVQLVCDARVLTLIQRRDRRVVGAVARIDGQERYVRARRGLILAGGGFIMNEAMVGRFAPQLKAANYPVGNPNDDGSGIRMGVGAGGAAINMSDGFFSTTHYPPGEFLESIIVNDAGQRFINEDVYHGRMGQAILENPGRRIYLVIDSRYFSLLERPPFGGYAVAGTGETIEELEGELELPQGTLCNTLAVYNRFAAEGRDPLFRKHPQYTVPLDQPPYAAFDLTPGRGGIFCAFTLGGLDTLPSGEVVTIERRPVPGLYAAGRNAAGLPRWGAGYSSGMSLGDCTFFGRLAGIAAASNEAI